MIDRSAASPAGTYQPGAEGNAEAPHAAARPLFILSCHRSGSTLLRFVLDTHPAIYSPPELFLGSAAFGMATVFAGLRGTVFDPDAMAGEGEETEEILAPVRQLLGAHLAEQTARRGKRLWCEKTPDNVDHLNLIARLFPDARYVCLYRHCLDVVKSAMEISDKIPALLPFLYSSRGHLVSALIRYWTEWNGRLQRFELNHPGACHRVLYEELVAAPVTAAAKLCGFLELTWDERLLAEVFTTRHDRGIEDFKVRSGQGIHQASVGAGRGVGLAGVPDKVLQAMREALAGLGYGAVAGVRDAGPAARGEAPGKPGRSIAWLFDTYLPLRFGAEPRLAEGIDGSYGFAFSGEGGGRWVINIGRDGLRPGAPGQHVDCAIHMAAVDFDDLIGGRLPPVTALRNGRVRIEGTSSTEVLPRLLAIFLQAGRSAPER